MLMKIVISFTVWSNFFQTMPINPEEHYLERYYYHQSRKTLWYTGYVTIVGYSGDGKSSMAEHMAISFIMKPKILNWGHMQGLKDNLEKTAFQKLNEDYINVYM
jgi:hypothetical protein